MPTAEKVEDGAYAEYAKHAKAVDPIEKDVCNSVPSP